MPDGIAGVIDKIFQECSFSRAMATILLLDLLVREGNGIVKLLLMR